MTTPGNGPASTLAGVGVAGARPRPVDGAVEQGAVAVGEGDALAQPAGAVPARAQGLPTFQPGNTRPGVSASRVGEAACSISCDVWSAMRRRPAPGGTPGSAAGPGTGDAPVGIVDVLQVAGDVLRAAGRAGQAVASRPRARHGHERERPGRRRAGGAVGGACPPNDDDVGVGYRSNVGPCRSCPRSKRWPPTCPGGSTGAPSCGSTSLRSAA